MQTVFLHVGMPKTGTSVLQYFFAQNADLLHKKGFLYPGLVPLKNAKNEYISDGNATLLARSLLEKTNPFYPNGDNVHLLKHIEATIKSLKNKNMLLSSEFFTDADERKLFNLNKIIRSCGAKCKVLCYLRRQDHFMLSDYLQGIKTSFFGEDVIDVHDYISKIKNHHHYNFCLFFKKFVNVFGKENIITRCYEKEQFYKGNVFYDFLNALNIPDSDMGDFILPKKKINISPPYSVINLMRIFNKLSPELTRKLLSYGDIWEEKLSEKGLFLDANSRIEIMKYYEEINKKIAHEFLGREDGRLFYEPLPEKEEKPLPQAKTSLDENLIKALGIIISGQQQEINALKSIKKDYAKIMFKLYSDNIVYSPSSQKLIDDITDSNHIDNIKVESAGIIIESIGNDPYFFIRKIKPIRGYTYILKIVLEAPADTLTQIFYQTYSKSNFCEENSAKYPVTAKINKIYFVFPLDFNGSFRVDPGDCSGRFLLKELKIVSADE